MNTIYAFIDAVLPVEWLSPQFMKNALLAVIVACPLFGTLGTVVVSNKMAFFSDAIGHSALTGIALGVLLGIPDPTVAMVLFSMQLTLHAEAVCLPPLLTRRALILRANKLT